MARRMEATSAGGGPCERVRDGNLPAPAPWLARRHVFALAPAAWLSTLPTGAPALSALSAASSPAVAAALLALSGCAGPTRRTAPPPPLPADKAAHVVFTAMAFLDVPYRFGGNGGQGSNTPAGGQARSREVAADGFDCSGFTRHVYERSLGLVLPRTAWDQARAASLARVDRDDLQPGDLVFFNTLQRPHSHVGIYVGDGRFVHAPRAGLRVRVEDMNGAAGRYWTQRFDGARRPALA